MDDWDIYLLFVSQCPNKVDQVSPSRNRRLLPHHEPDNLINIFKIVNKISIYIFRST